MHIKKIDNYQNLETSIDLYRKKLKIKKFVCVQNYTLMKEISFSLIS